MNSNRSTPNAAETANPGKPSASRQLLCCIRAATGRNVRSTGVPAGAQRAQLHTRLPRLWKAAPGQKLASPALSYGPESKKRYLRVGCVASPGPRTTPWSCQRRPPSDADHKADRAARAYAFNQDNLHAASFPPQKWFGRYPSGWTTSGLRVMQGVIRWLLTICRSEPATSSRKSEDAGRT